MSEKIKLQAVSFDTTMTAPTRIQTLEADVKIEARYKDETEFTVVSDTAMVKGAVKSEAGQWEMVPANKYMEERRVTITPKNIAWYKSRTNVKSIKAGPGDFIGSPGEKFPLEGTEKRTPKVRKDALQDALDAKKNKFAAAAK